MTRPVCKETSLATPAVSSGAPPACWRFTSSGASTAPTPKSGRKHVTAHAVSNAHRDFPAASGAPPALRAGGGRRPRQARGPWGTPLARYFLAGASEASPLYTNY